MPEQEPQSLIDIEELNSEFDRLDKTRNRFAIATVLLSSIGTAAIVAGFKTNDLGMELVGAGTFSIAVSIFTGIEAIIKHIGANTLTEIVEAEGMIVDKRRRIIAAETH